MSSRQLKKKVGMAMRKAEKKPAPIGFAAWFAVLPWGSKTMNAGNQNKTQGGRTPGRGLVSGWACAMALCLLVLCGPSSFAGRFGGPRAWRLQRAQAARPAPMRTAPARPQETRPANPAKGNSGNPNGAARPGGYPAPARPGGGNPGVMGPGVNGGARPGHLGDWLNNHQNLSPQQQEQELRREPGFNRLSPEAQQRVLNRLRSLDSRPPEQRQRILQRNEMFEGLSLEQKADVRMSSQSLAGMAPDRQRMVRQAFVDLRGIPPGQRAQILNSARFSQTFTPDERHVLGSLLSIEPYEPR
jgi:hypothetical protein